MLDYEYGKCKLTCDSCGEQSPELDGLQDAIDYKNKNNWGSRYNEDEDEWEDICPDCK